MDSDKLDRRVQRTRQLLVRTLMELIAEKSYDAITIQDITDRANLGRTTFYLHYQTKDDLLLGHFADFATSLNLNSMSREELLGDPPSAALVTFLTQLSGAQTIYHAFTAGKEAKFLLRGIQEQMMQNLGSSLNAAFPDYSPNLSLDLLTQYIVGAQLALMDWWMTTRTDYSAEQLAAALHQLQRAAVRDAYGVVR
ncbi:MAG: helix-turn-helix domain-containing protein [Anaerolineae bacterium]